MSALHYVRVYKCGQGVEGTTPENRALKRLWVIEHQKIEKPLNKIKTVSTSRMFLSKTGLKAVRDQIDLVLK